MSDIESVCLSIYIQADFYISDGQTDGFMNLPVITSGFLRKNSSNYI